MQLYYKNEEGDFLPVQLNLIDTRNQLLVFELGDGTNVPCQEEVEQMAIAIHQAIPKGSRVIIVPSGYLKTHSFPLDAQILK